MKAGLLGQPLLCGFTTLELSKTQCNNTDINNTDYSDTDPFISVPEEN